jgi:polysaccharide pyruvyl transferase WcaK-like protein
MFARDEEKLIYRLIGWYNRANCGDDAFVDAFHALLPHGELAFYEPSTGLLNPAKGEKLILGGGDVIKPYYLRRIPPDQPLWVVGCGLGYESELDLLSKHTIAAAVFRNVADAELAKKAGIKSFYGPDLCFALEGLGGTPPPEAQKTRKKLGVILSGHPVSGIDQPQIREAAYFEYFQWELASTLDELADYFDIVWISFSSDPDAWDESSHYGVRRKMTKRGGQSFRSYAPATAAIQRRVVAEMDLVLTMKFHGAIFSTIERVPFVSIGMTRKLEEFCRQSGLASLCVPSYQFTKHSALKAVKAAEAPDVPSRLGAIASDNRRLLKQAFQAIGLLDNA